MRYLLLFLVNLLLCRQETVGQSHSLLVCGPPLILVVSCFSILFLSLFLLLFFQFL